MGTDDDAEVHDAPERSRYEATVEGGLAAIAVYEVHDDAVVFVHTETMSGYGGRGIATSLVRGALDDVRRRAGRVVAVCPFVRAFITEHAQYADLLR